MAPWAANALESDLHEMENRVGVRMAATFGLLDCRAHERVEEVLVRSELENIDFIPVRDRHRAIVGVLSRAEAESQGESIVQDIMTQLNSRMLVGGMDPLLTVVETMDEGLEFRLVLANGNIDGILTLSDLQKLPVRSLLFARITHLEMLMVKAIEARCEGNDELWLDTLGRKRSQALTSRWSRLQSRNIELLRRLEATDFADKSKALLKLRCLPDRDSNHLQQMLYEIKTLRNNLAHAASFASSPQAARRTVRLVKNMKGLIADLRGAVTRPRAAPIRA